MSLFLLVSQSKGPAPRPDPNATCEVGDRCPACQEGYLAFCVMDYGGDQTWLGHQKPSHFMIEGLVCQHCGQGYKYRGPDPELGPKLQREFTSFANPTTPTPTNCTRCANTLARQSFPITLGTSQYDWYYLGCTNCGLVHRVEPCPRP